MYLVFVLLFGIVASAMAQVDSLWGQRYNLAGNIAMCEGATSLAQGGFALAGVGSDSCCLLRVDAVGDSLWFRTYGAEIFYDIAEQSDGGLALAEGGWQLVRTDSQGSVLWSSSYLVDGLENSICHALVTMPDGGFAVAGSQETYFVYPSEMDIFVVRTDATGDTLWTNRLDSDVYSYEGYDLVTTPDNGVVVAGGHRSHPFLAKFDTYGNVEWTRAFPGRYFKSAVRVADGYIGLGYALVPGHGTDLLVAKTNFEGDSIWWRTYGSLGDDFPGAVARASDSDGIIAAGSMYGNASLLRLNADGDSLWRVSIQMLDNTCFYSVMTLPDGGYAAAGVYYGSWSDPDDGWQFLLVRFSTDGVPVSPLPPGAVFTHSLFPNYPNPFNATTTISFELPRESDVLLNVFDITGRSVVTLADGMMAAGEHAINFDASALPSGIYVYRLQAGGFQESRKLVVLK